MRSCVLCASPAPHCTARYQRSAHGSIAGGRGSARGCMSACPSTEAGTGEPRTARVHGCDKAAATRQLNSCTICCALCCSSLHAKLTRHRWWRLWAARQVEEGTFSTSSPSGAVAGHAVSVTAVGCAASTYDRVLVKPNGMWRSLLCRWL